MRIYVRPPRPPWWVRLLIGGAGYAVIAAFGFLVGVLLISN